MAGNAPDCLTCVNHASSKRDWRSERTTSELARSNCASEGTPDTCLATMVVDSTCGRPRTVARMRTCHVGEIMRCLLLQILKVRPAKRPGVRPQTSQPRHGLAHPRGAKVPVRACAGAGTRTRTGIKLA